MPILFSIIIPTFNRANFIKNTIESILIQDYANYELIVVDDGSSDNTKEIVSGIIQDNSTKKIKYIHQVNSERGVARNNGLKASSGEYVMYMDSDDTLYQNHLSVANEFILNNKYPEVFHLRYDLKNQELKKYGEGPIYKTTANKDLIFGNFLSCNGVVIRKDIALENQFEENRAMATVEDWHLWLRLAVKYPIHYCNTITSSIINHEERSVVITNKDKLILRFDTFMQSVLSNPSITSYYSKDLNKFKASCFSYISLHLALTGKNKRTALAYLFKSIKASKSFLLTKRFFAILRRII
ncbi:MAG: glycosyltransferase family 2 protein [Bacteroidia bacterium]|nr:glycosyltransferase family 2 protein [Bacteroidia bacterium]